MIDATDPAVLDVHDFRRAGASKRLQRTVELAEPPSNPVVAVVEGPTIELDLLLESVIEGILVSGTANYPLRGECSRCLDPIATSGQVRLSELYLWDEPEELGEDPLPLVTDGLIDLRPELLDAIGLELPLAPVCSEQCPGLCPDCGLRLVDTPGHHHEQVDPRWSALQNWESDTDGGETTGMGDTGSL